MSGKLRLPQFLVEDFFYKLFTLLLATLIWLFVSQQVKRESATFTVPVVVSYDEDKMVVEPRSFNVQVVVRGSRGSLDRLSSEDIEIDLGVPLLDEGIRTYELRISPTQARVPSGVQIEEVHPPSVTLQVDRIINKEVSVRVRERGVLPTGYQVQERRLVPGTARIVGPSRLLAEINEVLTDPIVLSETTTQSFQQENVRLSVPGGARVSPRTVHVSYEISRHAVVESFNQLPVRVMVAVDSGLLIASSLPPVSVTIRGPSRVLEQMQSHQVYPFIDLTAITSPGHYSRSVEVWLADNRATIEYVHPSELEIELVGVEPSDQSEEPPPSPQEGRGRVPESGERSGDGLHE